MLRYFKEYTFQEIAIELGVSYGSAKNHVYRGINRLREIVRPREVTENRPIPSLLPLESLEELMLSKEADNAGFESQPDLLVNLTI